MMSRKIHIHKDDGMSPVPLWWKPMFSWQKKMNETLFKNASPPLGVPAFWNMEQDVLGGVQQSVNRIYGELFNSRQMFMPWWVGKHTEPYVDIIEGNKSFIIKADVPGVDMDDLDVSISEDGALMITGERKDCSKEEGEYFVRRECCEGSFSRVIAIPEGANIDKATMNFDRNVLTIEIPKQKNASFVPRKLEMNNNQQGKQQKRDAA